MGVAKDTALATLDSLEDRLRRVEWYLSGSNEVDDNLQKVVNEGNNDTILARLAELESNLDRLSAHSPTVNALLKLNRKYPDFFQPSISGIPTTLSTSEILSIVQSCATSYPTTASRLNAIKDLPIPSTESSASLIALHPTLAKVELQQAAQAREMAELRSRTAAAIQRWYELGVLGESECWAEWEGRVEDVEKVVRREELHRMQQDKEDAAYRAP